MLNEKSQKRLEEFIQKQEEKKLKLKLRRRKSKKKKNNKTKESKPQLKKRKVGRPKKRGPKKKRVRRKIVIVKKKRPVIDFKIVSMLNGKQNDYIGSYQTYTDAYAKLQELKTLNENVIFPRCFLNNGTINKAKDEYLILERNRFGDKDNNLLRNEFGKFVEQKIVNNTKWVVREKITRLVEETFWVYGFDPKTNRKTYQWIIENLIISNIENSYDIIRVLIYKNKLIIRYDNKPMRMVMCKNKSDAIRLYNAISEEVRNKKIKQVICIGAYNIICDSRRELEQAIMELTGWDKRKIQRSTN
jgi:hypothetical protein